MNELFIVTKYLSLCFCVPTTTSIYKLYTQIVLNFNTYKKPKSEAPRY